MNILKLFGKKEKLSSLLPVQQKILKDSNSIKKFEYLISLLKTPSNVWVYGKSSSGKSELSDMLSRTFSRGSFMHFDESPLTHPERLKKLPRLNKIIVVSSQHPISMNITDKWKQLGKPIILVFMKRPQFIDQITVI